MSRLVLIDTSVLVELLRVPGMDAHHAEVREELDDLVGSGARLAIPVTTLVETGNHIAHVANGHERREAALRFAALVRRVLAADAPWQLVGVEWDEDFLHRLLAGDSTGTDLVEHACHETLGSGDLAILVQRDLLRERSAGLEVAVWTRDERLRAYAGG